jgi:2-polyprenyl-3-methyl-5-hydroxy-6-metoxy-1,4-benzoquinol methylase
LIGSVVSPRPDFEDLAIQYEGGYFHCPQPTFGGYEDYESDRSDILRTFERRLALLRPLLPIPSPRLLDLGCATGFFLEVAAAAGCSVEGLDISSYAVERARQKGFRVHRGELEEMRFRNGAFDALTMWDIVEHVSDPQALLMESSRILAPGGVLAISTPDTGSITAKILGGRWLGFRSIDEHLYFFSRRTITQMLAQAGFEVRRITSIGKYLSLPRIVARLRYYTRIGALLLRSVDRLVPNVSLYLNPLDTMCVIAQKRG